MAKQPQNGQKLTKKEHFMQKNQLFGYFRGKSRDMIPVWGASSAPVYNFTAQRAKISISEWFDDWKGVKIAKNPQNVQKLTK